MNITQAKQWLVPRLNVITGAVTGRELPPESLPAGRRIAKSAMIVLSIAIGGILVWAAVAPLSAAVVMMGNVIVDFQRKTVQHLEGGIVREILVHPGQKVVQGQPLLILEDVAQSASVMQQRDQLDAVLALGARLAAEKLNRPRVELPEELLSRLGEPKVAKLVSNEESFFVARLAALNESVRLLRQQIAETESQQANFREQVSAAERTIAIAKTELDKAERLHAQGFVSHTTVMAARRTVAEKEEQRAAHVADQEEAKAKVTGLRLQIANLYDGRSKEAAQELRDTEKKLYELKEQLRPSEDVLRRRTVTAPISGEVVGLKVFTAGGVIRPGEPLMDIIPENESLIIEGRVSPRDIEPVRLGQAVEVELSAYRRRMTPLVDGTVKYISGDTLDDAAHPTERYYVVHVEVTPHALKVAGDLQLLPGMPVVAFIKNRDRTAFDYLFEPITDVVRRSMRER